MKNSLLLYYNKDIVIYLEVKSGNFYINVYYFDKYSKLINPHINFLNPKNQKEIQLCKYAKDLGFDIEIPVEEFRSTKKSAKYFKDEMLEIWKSRKFNFEKEEFYYPLIEEFDFQSIDYKDNKIVISELCKNNEQHSYFLTRFPYEKIDWKKSKLNIYSKFEFINKLQKKIDEANDTNLKNGIKNEIEETAEKLKELGINFSPPSPEYAFKLLKEE